MSKIFKIPQWWFIKAIHWFILNSLMKKMKKGSYLFRSLKDERFRK